MMFVMEEYALEKYDFCPDCYPQFAEKYPDSPCATWENDGLLWGYGQESPDAPLDWVVYVLHPSGASAAFPLPTAKSRRWEQNESSPACIMIG